MSRQRTGLWELDRSVSGGTKCPARPTQQAQLCAAGGFPALMGLSGHIIREAGAAITPPGSLRKGGLETHSTLERSWCPEEKEQTPHWSLVLETPSHSSHCGPGRVLRSLTAVPSASGSSGTPTAPGGPLVPASRSGRLLAAQQPWMGANRPLGLSDNSWAPSPWSRRATQGTEPRGPQGDQSVMPLLLTPSSTCLSPRGSHSEASLGLGSFVCSTMSPQPGSESHLQKKTELSLFTGEEGGGRGDWPTSSIS